MRLPQMGSQSAEQGPSPVYQELPHEELPPVAVIGGLLTGPECEGWYRRTLDIDQESELPTNKRFIAPYKRGLGSIADMKEDFEERLQGLHEDADNRKLFLVGHSLGGLMATMAAVERPDLVAGVVSLGGVHEGYRVDTAATHALKFLFGRHPEAGHLRHDSDFMLEHTGKISSDWPEDVSLHVISTPFDALVVPPQGFGVNPANRPAEKHLVIPHIPGFETAARKGWGLKEDVQMMRSLRIVEHINLPRNPEIIKYIAESRFAKSNIETIDSVSPNEYFTGTLGNDALAA